MRSFQEAITTLAYEYVTHQSALQRSLSWELVNGFDQLGSGSRYATAGSMSRCPWAYTLDMKRPNRAMKER